MSYFDENTLAQIQTGQLILRVLIKTTLGGVVWAIWNDVAKIVVDEVEYVGGCAIADLSGIGEAEGLSASEATVVLNAANADIFADFKTKSWHLQRIDIRGMLFDDAQRSFFTTPVFRHVGLIEKSTVAESTKDQATLTLRVADLIQRSRTVGSGFLTDGDQRRRKETDSILRGVSALSRTTTLVWGKSSPSHGNQHVHGQTITGR